MTVNEFLLKIGVDLFTNKNILANKLKGDLCVENHFLDFNKDVADLTNKDKYQIGRSLELYLKDGIAFYCDFVKLVDILIEYAKESDEKSKDKIIKKMKSYIINSEIN